MHIVVVLSFVVVDLLFSFAQKTLRKQQRLLAQQMHNDKLTDYLSCISNVRKADELEQQKKEVGFLVLLFSGCGTFAHF